MLDTTTDPQAKPGPIFVVESSQHFHAGRPDGLRVRVEPEAIPGGYMATYEDQAGNTIYVLDQSEDAAASGTT